MGINDLLFFFGLLATWFVLNRYVLPWFGISTCMSCSCAVEKAPPGEGKKTVIVDRETVEPVSTKDP